MVPPQTVDLKLHPIVAELKLINPQADWLLSTISTKMISGLYESNEIFYMWSGACGFTG